MSQSNLRALTFLFLVLTLLCSHTPVQAARFAFESRNGTLVWDGDSDAVTSNRLTQFPDPEDRTVSDFGFGDPVAVLFELDLTIGAFDPADFPNGLVPFGVNYLRLYLTIDAGNATSTLLCQPAPGWAGCDTLSDVVPPDVDDLDPEGPTEVDLFTPVVAFVGELGPTGPAADGDLFTLMPEFFDDYAAAVARFGAQNLIIGLSASFASNCVDDDFNLCVEEGHLVTTQTPEPASIALLAMGLASVAMRRRRT